MYLDQPLKDFISDTSSRSPTPGGGSVAALTGALGSSLLSMVGNFTLGKEKFKLVEREIQEILTELSSFTRKLSGLIQEDISIYENFSRVSSFPKTSPEDKKIRDRAMQDALKKAAEVPLKVAERCLELLKIASQLLKIGNPRLISDVGVGAILAEAALKSAALNVEINLSYIKDEGFIERKKEILLSFLDKGKELTTEIVRKVRERIVT